MALKDQQQSLAGGSSNLPAISTSTGRSEVNSILADDRAESTALINTFDDKVWSDILALIPATKLAEFATLKAKALLNCGKNEFSATDIKKVQTLEKIIRKLALIFGVYPSEVPELIEFINNVILDDNIRNLVINFDASNLV